MEKNIKYGFAQKVDKALNVGEGLILECAGELYQIMFCGEDINTVDKYQSIPSLQNTCLLKYEVISSGGSRQIFNALNIVNHLNIEKAQSMVQRRKKQNKEGYKKELLEELEQEGITTGLDMVLCGVEYFEKKFRLSRVSTILGKTLHGLIKISELIELAEKLGFDLKHEIQEHVADKPGIADEIKNVGDDFNAMIEIIRRQKRSEDEYCRVEDKRTIEKDQCKKELLEELKHRGITGAMSLILFGTEHFENTFGRTKIGTILGKTLYGQVLREELMALSKELGRDLVEEVKERLHVKAGISDMKSLLDYGQHKFVETFGLRIVGIVNGKYSRANFRNLLEFGKNLGRNLKNDIIKLLKDKGIHNALDLLKRDPSNLYDIKKYVGLLGRKTINGVPIQEKYILCEQLGRDIPKVIADSIINFSNGSRKKRLDKVIVKMGLKYNTIKIIHDFYDGISENVGYNILDRLLEDLDNDIHKKFKVKTPEQYIKLPCRDMRCLGLRSIGLALGHNVPEVTYGVKVELGKKLGYVE